MKRKNYNIRHEFRNHKQHENYLNDDGSVNHFIYKKDFSWDLPVPTACFDFIIDLYKNSYKDKTVRKFIETHLDNIMIILNSFYYMQLQNIKSNVNKIGTPIPDTFFKPLAGQKYYIILDFLIKHGLIYTDNLYCNLENIFIDSKRYCRHFEFLIPVEDDCVIYSVTNRPALSRLCKAKYSTSTEYLEIEEDVKNNNKYLNEYFSKYFEFTDEVHENSDLDSTGYVRYFLNVNIAGDSSKRLENFNIGRDSFGNRLYHPYTHIGKKLRKFIAIDGETNTGMLDINNSHPFFLSLLFDKKFLDNVKHILKSDEYEFITHLIDSGKYDNHISILQNVTSNGGYYTQLCEWMPGLNRELVKEKHMYYLYGSKWKQSNFHPLFQKRYPFITMLKDFFDKKKDYKRMAQLLQRIESYVLIDLCFGRMVEEDMKVLPIHDAFMGKSVDMPYIREVVENIVVDLTSGLKPSFNNNAGQIDLSEHEELLRKGDFSKFLDRNISLEKMNELIKKLGVKNRVFKMGMKELAMMDRLRKELSKDNILLSVEELNEFDKLYDKFCNNDWSPKRYIHLYDEYIIDSEQKLVWYAKGKSYADKLNPMEWYNKVFGTGYKTRVREWVYCYR